MQIGWIDFSKEDRQKVLSVIDLLSEKGTLDELGVAPIRDGFSDLFFPGTSTIQTRAKYFFIVPYILVDLTQKPDINPNLLQARLDKEERRCAEILLAQDAAGTIGRNSLRENNWVKRPPSSIYWAGLRTFGIFTKPGMTINEYFRAVSILRKHKHGSKENRIYSDKEYEADDQDAGNSLSISFWNIPDHKDWMEKLGMELTKEEALFLKQQIEVTQPDSMLAFVLKNNLTNISRLNNFSDLGNIGVFSAFPEQLKKDYLLAKQFVDFYEGLSIRYNVMISQGRNDSAVTAWNDYASNLAQHANLNIPLIFQRLHIHNPRLRSFLTTVQEHMLSGNIDQLDKTIHRREVQLKGAARAKLNQPGSFPINQWYGIKTLDYRFRYARTIMTDIFCSLEAESC